VQCEETVTRTQDLPVTGGKALPLAPGPPFIDFTLKEKMKKKKSQAYSCAILLAA
jgi:hypothetical protein